MTTLRYFIITFLLTLHPVIAQNFTEKDSLQGGLRFERTCFNVLQYNLDITINPEKETIVGYNKIIFETTQATQKIQLDLFENMTVDSIIWNKQKMKYKRRFGAVFITFPTLLQAKNTETITFYYSGQPKKAKNAPWNGGFVFTKDKQNKPFIGVAVQGTGASLWYPVKDSQTDEPDYGATIKIAVPNEVMAVANGKFKAKKPLKNGYTQWHWEVTNPINNYNITVNIADYVHIHDTHNGLSLDYYVHKNNKDKAYRHFNEDVKPMLDCFSEKFGDYPFWKDGYKLVETPYLGMEHQSAIAYGNKYKKGYLGSDLSGTGIGLGFDFIIIHETAHEWFGNSITSKDIADMWIHEAFTTYSESVFVECKKGYEKALQYCNGQAKLVRNDKPIIGIFGVNNKGSNDMYYKGALLLNTLRHVINNDTKWWQLLYDFSIKYKHKIIDTETVIAFFNKETGLSLTPIFKQYLNQTTLPRLKYQKVKNNLFYQWENVHPNFAMPVDIYYNTTTIRLYPTTKKQKIRLKKMTNATFKIAKNKFFIEVVEGKF